MPTENQAPPKKPGAYVPPHRRRQETTETVNAAKTSSLDVTVSKSNQQLRQQQQHHHRQADYSWTTNRTHQYRYQNQCHNIQSSTHYNHVPNNFTIPSARVCCINLPNRSDKWQSVMSEAHRVGGPTFCRQIERFEAIDGRKLIRQEVEDNQKHVHDDDDYNGSNNNQQQLLLTSWMDLVQPEWDATKNAKYSHRVTHGKRAMSHGEIGCALSHIMLWKSHAAASEDEGTTRTATAKNNWLETSLLILEDDCMFTAQRRKTRFPLAFEKTMRLLPPNWGILYLGFSSRGPRHYVDDDSKEKISDNDLPIRIYKPSYGFHTHGYMLTKEAAATLLQNLPVTGPLDVWLADNSWFGIPVYCSVIANEGWYNEETHAFEGANLIGQNKRRLSSDVDQSAHIS